MTTQYLIAYRRKPHSAWTPVAIVPFLNRAQVIRLRVMKMRSLPQDQVKIAQVELPD